MAAPAVVQFQRQYARFHDRHPVGGNGQPVHSESTLPGGGPSPASQYDELMLASPPPPAAGMTHSASFERFPQTAGNTIDGKTVINQGFVVRPVGSSDQNTDPLINL